MHQGAVSVIIPAYNEEKTINDVILSTNQILDGIGLPYEIIVVDDGSTDKTGLIASTHKVTLLSNKHNRGKGYCLRRGLKSAHGNIIVTMDSDGEHKPKEIPELIEPLFNGTDIVAGSRFLGSQTQVSTKLNTVGNYLFNISIMLLTGRWVTDSQTGFRAIKRGVIEKLNLESDGYDIETEITVKSLRNGFVFKELPISYEKRRYNHSKVKVLFDGIKIMKTIVRANYSKIEHGS